MPWCEGCSRFWNPNSLTSGGHCPTCGRTVATGLATKEASAGAEEAPAKAPWHFTLMLVALVVYLAWRMWQLVAGLL